MTVNVLVAYATKNGSTAEIARTIADTLDEQGMHAVARPAGEVVDLGSYDAVVLGSALYAGRWLREARRFTRRHERALVALPMWLFSSGPLDASAHERLVPPVAARRLDAREHVTFGGRLEEGASGWVARMLIKQGRGGDFRDMEQIRAWSQAIAKELAAERPFEP
jgi:menaquinone-dependent protoporphyrinogen oxidase